MTHPVATSLAFPTRFDSEGYDRTAIETLLATYAHAVSTKNQALFEALLLDKTIPFSAVSASGPVSRAGISNYESFRKRRLRGSAFYPDIQEYPRGAGRKPCNSHTRIHQQATSGRVVGLEDIATAEGERYMEDRERVLHFTQAGVTTS
jgi:hypothetical protein